MPVEVTAADIVRLGLASEDELQDSPRKTSKRLEKEGVTISYRAGTGLYTLRQLKNGDCRFLGEDRLCQVYENRPEVCRKFPAVGPRPGYCPAMKIVDVIKFKGSNPK